MRCPKCYHEVEHVCRETPGTWTGALYQPGDVFAIRGAEPPRVHNAREGAFPTRTMEVSIEEELTPTREDVFRLLRESMERSMEEMADNMNRDMYRFGTGTAMVAPAPTRRERVHRMWARVRRYLQTVWRALRGDELDTPTEWD